MIIVLLLLFVGLIGGIYLAEKTYCDLSGFILSVVCGVCLFFALILLPTNYYEGKGDIQEYYALEQTINNARSNGANDIERAALTSKIAETNMWLASTQYWNNTIFDIYIPDDVMELKVLQ